MKWMGAAQLVVSKGSKGGVLEIDVEDEAWKELGRGREVGGSVSICLAPAVGTSKSDGQAFWRSSIK